MKVIYGAVLFTVCICDVLLVTGFEGPRCFLYTWPGSGIEPDCTEYNEKFPGIPCLKWLVTGLEKPNTTEIWEEQKRDNNETLLCRLEDGNVCVRYTYIYNKAVMNVSYFCGKVIEDKTTAIESGCFLDYIEGYTIEACACKSKTNAIPCNSTKRIANSILITFTATAVNSLFIYKMFNIP